MAVLSQKEGGPGLFAARGVDLGQLNRATGNGIQDSEMQPSAAVSQCFSFRMESDQSEQRSREPGRFPELSATSHPQCLHQQNGYLFNTLGLMGLL